MVGSKVVVSTDGVVSSGHCKVVVVSMLSSMLSGSFKYLDRMPPHLVNRFRMPLPHVLEQMDQLDHKYSSGSMQGCKLQGSNLTSSPLQGLPSGPCGTGIVHDRYLKLSYSKTIFVSSCNTIYITLFSLRLHTMWTWSRLRIFDTAFPACSTDSSLHLGKRMRRKGEKVKATIVVEQAFSTAGLGHCQGDGESKHGGLGESSRKFVTIFGTTRDLLHAKCQPHSTPFFCCCF